MIRFAKFLLPLLLALLLVPRLTCASTASVNANQAGEKAVPASELTHAAAHQNETEKKEYPPDHVLMLVTEIEQDLSKLFVELIEKHKQAEPWKERWNEARNRVIQINNRAHKLADSFAGMRGLLLSLVTFERHFSQILPSVSIYKHWASPMEAVNGRLALVLRDLDSDYAPLYDIHEECKQLLENVTNLASVSMELQKNDKDYLAYQKDLNTTKQYLEQNIKQQKEALTPVENLRQQIEKVQQDIAQMMPNLWQQYYLQSPINWLEKKTWQYLPKQWEMALTGMQLRRSLEIPTDTNDWQRALLRALVSGILFTILLVLLSHQKWVPTDTNPHMRHMFHRSLPCIFAGLCLLLSSFSPHGENFRAFLAMGNLFMILGQVLLAWDLRMLSSTDVPTQHSPLLRLLPLTFLAYLLLYLPLLPIVVWVLWLCSVTAVLIWRFFWPDLSIGSLKLENNIRAADGLVLWLSLILSILGLPIISMILYLVCVSISLAIELCLGAINRINYLNENQPSEGIRAILSNIVVSLAAPIIMLVTVSSVLLWVATLPGGMVLMGEYLFKNVSVGSAEFNFLHILLIISAFFLTKAVVVTGTRYLQRLFTARKTVDATLIAPAQTAFTYTTWIIFAIFVLRILDIDLKNAAMVLTGLTVGIGMGLQSIVNNFFSGLLLIFGRMMQVGDVVEVSGITGKVSRISVRDTLVQTFDNAFIYVPNSEFISGHLVNWSRNDATVRANVSVGVAYGTDTELVIRTLKQIVNKHERILRYPEPAVTFNNFGDNTLDFAVYFWVNRFDDKVKTCTEVRLAIDKEFAAKNIEIAYPQLDVHLKTKEKRAHALPTSFKPRRVAIKRKRQLSLDKKKSTN